MVQTIGPSTGWPGLTTYDQTLNTAYGSVPTVIIQRDLRKAAAAIEPRDTPFLTTVGYGETVNQEKHEWARKSWTPIKSALAAAWVASASPGNLVFTAAEAAKFAKWMVLQVDDEIFWVNGTPSGTNVPVVPAQGGTTAAAHASAAVVYIIGTAMPQLNDYALSPFSWGDQYYNYPQRFSGAHRTDRRANVTPNYEMSGNQHDQLVVDQLTTQKTLLEQALFKGRRQAGSPAVGAERPSFLGGLREFVGQPFDKSTAVLNIYHLEEAFVTFDTEVGVNAPRQIIMNMKTYQIISRLLNPRREWRGDTTSLNLVWKSIQFITGDYTFMISRNIPDGEIWLLNTKDLSVLPYQSLGWHERPLPVFGEHMWTGVGGDFTFEARSPKAIGRIFNFSTTLSSYPSI